MNFGEPSPAFACQVTGRQRVFMTGRLLNMKKFVAIVLLSVAIGSLSCVQAQLYYRIECDISIKHKVAGEDGMLVMGRVYYDKVAGRAVFDIRFPDKEVWVIEDTLVTVYKDGESRQTRGMEQFTQATIFHLILEGDLNNFGLHGTIYNLDAVRRDQEMVITTWVPRPGNQALGRIHTSTVDGTLYGVVFENFSGEVIGRQVFRDYETVRGLNVPREIIQVFYREGSEEYQVYSLSNVRINYEGNEAFYHYRGPGH